MKKPWIVKKDESADVAMSLGAHEAEMALVSASRQALEEHCRLAR